MKYFHLVLLFIMILFTALQWNDIDGPIWIFIYLATALLALITYKQICLACTIAWTLIIILLGSFMLIAVVPGIVNFLEANAYTEIFFVMNDDKPYIELMREALGLTIILLYCVSILIHTFLKKKHNKSE